MSNTTEEEKPKKKRGRPAGYRKSEDGTWYKLGEESNVKTPKVVEEKDPDENIITDSIYNEDDEDFNGPSDEELNELEQNNEFINENDNSFIDCYERIIQDYIIRPITFDYEKSIAKDGYMSKCRPYIDYNSVMTFIDNQNNLDFYFNTFEQFLNLKLKVSLDDVENIATKLIEYNYINTNEPVSYIKDGRPLYVLQDIKTKMIIALLVPSKKFDETYLSLKCIAPVSTNVIIDSPLRSKIGFYALYLDQPSTDYVLDDFSFIRSDNDNSDTNVFGMILKKCSKETFDSTQLIYSFISYYSLENDDEEERDLSNDTLDKNEDTSYIDDINDDFNDSSDIDDSLDMDDTPYLIDDDGNDDPYLSYCDQLIDKSVKELRGNKPLSYEQIFYPGTNKDRREFDSLDNGNFRHRPTGLSDEYNMDDID
jgi:hypothetical protein